MTLCIAILTYACNEFLTEAGAIITLNSSSPALSQNEQLTAKRTCDGSDQSSGTHLDFLRLNAFDGLPDVKPVSKRTTIEDAMQKYSRAQTSQRIGLSLQEELSSSFSGMPC